MVPIAEKNRVVCGEKPVSSGTRKVAPNIATTCCRPIPVVRGQLSRSPGDTTAPGAIVRPSPCSFQLQRWDPFEDKDAIGSSIVCAPSPGVGTKSSDPGTARVGGSAGVDTAVVRRSDGREGGAGPHGSGPPAANPPEVRDDRPADP
ncbi:hypothetical protein CELD12_02900 [Cellulomonas sp. NTE-D12]|nr:hypothetical protein CELD12_02900 [Cellulomonas sp. NTE-D12]